MTPLEFPAGLPPHEANMIRGVGAPKTAWDYVHHLRQFQGILGIKSSKKMLNLPAAKIDTMFEKFIDRRRAGGVKWISVRTAMAGPERFFIMNDMIWHKERIHKSMGTDSEIPAGEVPYSKSDVQRMLRVADVRRAALVHFFNSTGARPGALADPVLRVRDVEKLSGGFAAIEIYRGYRERYWAFLTPQANRAMQKYIKSRRAKPDDFLFPTYYRGKKRLGYIRSCTADYNIDMLVKRGGVERRRVGRGWDKPVVYGFRKRFATQLKLSPKIDDNIVEKLLGHKRGLNGAYLKPSREELFTEFKKAEGLLRV